MNRLRAILLLVSVSVGCGSEPGPIRDMVFLTRGDCVNTATMRANLDAALKMMNRPTTYEFIDLDGLPKDDPRTGYPTPTILIAGRDLFGLPKPMPPYPEST